MKSKWSGLMVFVGLLFGGFVGGYAGGNYLGDVDFSIGQILVGVGVLILSFFAHLIIHEFGHLLFGKWTGYSFLSFRLFSYVWVKEEGSIILRRLKIPGTLGQCLMVPPPFKGEKMPFKLYLLGGGLLNLIASVLVLGMSLVLQWQSLHVFIFVIVGCFLAVGNLVPMGFNDGMMLKNAWNNKEVQRFLHIQLTVNAQTTNGMRYTELNDEWLKAPTTIQYDDLFHVWTMLIHYNCALERGDFTKGKEIIDDLWTNIDKNLLYYSEIAKEWAFCQLYFDENKQEVERLFNDRKIKSSLSMFTMGNGRVKGMYAWKVERNEEKAIKEFEDGLKYAKYHSNKGDMLFEEGLIKRCLGEVKGSVLD